MARAGAKALSSLSESRHNIEAMRKYGLVPLMARLLKSIHFDVVVNMMSTCQQCATQVRVDAEWVKFCEMGLRSWCFVTAIVSIGNYDRGDDTRYRQPFEFR